MAFDARFYRAHPGIGVNIAVARNPFAVPRLPGNREDMGWPDESRLSPPKWGEPGPDEHRRAPRDRGHYHASNRASEDHERIIHWHVDVRWIDWQDLNVSGISGNRDIWARDQVTVLIGLPMHYRAITETAIKDGWLATAAIPIAECPVEHGRLVLIDNSLHAVRAALQIAGHRSVAAACIGGGQFCVHVEARVCELTAEPSIDSRIRRSRDRPSRQSRLSPPLFPFTRILLSDFNNLPSQAKTRVLSCSRRPMSSLHRTSPSPLGNAKLPVYQTNLIPFPNTKEGGVQPARGLSPSLGRVRNQPPAIM